jgi:hypothetical protein
MIDESEQGREGRKRFGAGEGVMAHLEDDWPPDFEREPGRIHAFRV